MHGMKLAWGWGLVCALTGCGGGGSGTNGQTDSNSGSETQGDTTQATAPTTTEHASESHSGTTAGSVSDSLTGETTAEPTGTTVDITVTDPETTTQTTQTTQTSLDTTDTTTQSSADDTTTEASADDTGTSTGTSTGETTDATTEGGESSTTDSGCIPQPEVCNKLDDDCNDLIDDLDVGMDGVCDCLSIAIVGNEGANPSSEFNAYLQGLGTTVVRLNSNVLNDVAAPLDLPKLNNYDIIILDWLQRTYTPDEAAAMRQWIENGGGLMTMTGHTNIQAIADRPNSIIGTMGLTYNTSKGFFSGPVTQFAVHPINQGLTSLTFLGGLYIDIVPDDVGSNEVIMTLPQGPVGVVHERLKGRAFVFGDEWVEFDSQWKNMPDIKQFWVQTLSFLGPKSFCSVPQ